MFLLKKLSMVSIVLFLFFTHPASADERECPEALDFYKGLLAKDEQVHLCDMFNNKVVLVVNTASRCAFTGQYEGLEALYKKYSKQGLVVAGFPSNDFAGQEPGSEEQIQKFCRTTYGVKFPMFEKTRVRGIEVDPFYAHLMKATGKKPMWNFHKYLIDRSGKVVESFSSFTKPDDPDLIDSIEELLR